MIKKLSILPLRGSVNLENPELSIWTVFQYKRMDDDSNTTSEGDSIENHQLQKVYVGRLIGSGGMRDVSFF